MESTIKYIKYIILLPFRFVWWVICMILHAMGLGWRRKIRSSADYVHFVSFYLKRNGFSHVYPPEESFSNGVDLLAAKGGKRYAVICHYADQEMGQEPIRRAQFGKSEYGVDAAIIVTNKPTSHSAWLMADAQGITVYEEISPDKKGAPITPKMLVTPKNVVAFAVGSVAFGAWFSHVFPSEDMDASAYMLMALACLALSWGVCTLLMWMLRQQLNR